MLGRTFFWFLALPASLTCASCLQLASFDTDNLDTEDPPSERYPQACYEGPEGTVDIGICRSGVRQSAEGDCEGQVLPQPECGLDDVDKNCDGHTGAFRWSRALEGDKGQELRDIALFADGSAVITGTSSGAASIGALEIGPGMFVIKVDSFGNPKWAFSFGAPGGAFGVSLAVDPNEDVWVTGYIWASTSFGGDTFTPPVGASRDVLVKLDGTTGAHEWSALVASGGDTGSCVVTVTPGGNVVLTGVFRNALVWPEGEPIPGDDENCMFVSYLDLEGHHLRSYKSAKEAYPRRVAVDDEGGVVVVGSARGHQHQDFGGGEVGEIETTSFVVKYDASGKHVWSRPLGTFAEPDWHRGLAVAPGGITAVTVPFSGVLAEINGKPVQADTQHVQVGVLVFAHDGGIIWAKVWGGDDDERPWDIAAAEDGWVVGGAFRGTLDTGTCQVTSQADDDAFLVRLDKSGNPLWVHTFGDPAADGTGTGDTVRGIAIDANGDIVIGGTWSGAVSWGDPPSLADIKGDTVIARYVH